MTIILKKLIIYKIKDIKRFPFQLQNLFENLLTLIYLSYVSKKNFLSIFISVIPISYILGNFILNLNILVIIIFGLVNYIQGFRFKVLIIDKIVVFFFLYIIFTSVWNTIEINFFNSNLNNYYIFNKSILFLRYLFLYFSMRLLVENKLIDFKIIFYSYSIVVSFVSIDIIFQFFNSKDLLGFTSPYYHKHTGPFNDEAIAGGFIQRYSLFIFYTFAMFASFKNLILKIFFLSFVLFLISISIIFSGNRMPLILFFISIFLILISNQTLKKYLIHSFVLIFLISFVSINLSPLLKSYYKSFFVQSEKILSLFSYRITGIGSDLIYVKRPNYIHEFDAGIGTFKLNKYFGGGIKSFRFNCPSRKIETINERTTCNMHPHNYYLEILTDLGIIGFLIFIALIILVLFKAYKVLLFSNNKYIFSPFFYVFIMEIFPIKSSGSFFTTNNSTIIFLGLGILVSFLSEKLVAVPRGIEPRLDD